MTVSRTIVHEPVATRRWRWLAPLVVLLAMALLIMAPGLLAERGDDAGSATEGALSRIQLTAHTP